MLANKPWVRKDSNLRRSHRDSRSTVWRNRRSATHPRTIASYGSRTRSNTSTGCHAIRYTNETNRLSGRAGESNPRHDIHSVACCHYTKLAITNFLAAGLAQRVQTPRRKRRDSNPHRPNERPRLANACDETDIRLSSDQTCPRQESNLDFELRTLAWFPFHHRDAHCLRQDSNPERSVRSAA